MKISHLLACFFLFSVALPSVACTCGRYSSFSELFATPDPKNRFVQALIVKNVGTDGSGVKVQVLDRLTPGAVEDRIVIFGADGVSCKGPIIRETGAIWIAAISREKSHLAAQQPAYDIASCSESFLSYDPDKKLAVGKGSQSNPRLTGRVSLADLRKRLNQDFTWNYTHLSCRSEIADDYNHASYGRKETLIDFDETDSLEQQIDYSIDVPMLDEPYRYHADISVSGNPGSVSESAHFDVVLRNETGTRSFYSEETHTLFMRTDPTFINFKEQYRGKVSGGGNRVCLPFSSDPSKLSGWCLRDVNENGGLVETTFLREDPNRSGPFSLRATLDCTLQAKIADASSHRERSASKQIEKFDTAVESFTEFGDRSAWGFSSSESHCSLDYFFPGGSMKFTYLKSNGLPLQDPTRSNSNSMKVLDYKAPPLDVGETRFRIRTTRKTQAGSVAVKLNDRLWHLDQGVLALKLGVLGSGSESDEVTQEIQMPPIQINYIDGTEADDLLSFITNPTQFILTATLLNDGAPLRLDLTSTRIADAASQFRACRED